MRSAIRLGVMMTLALLSLPAGVQAQGLYLPGGGAAHLSMGGASTATPVDAIGALYWNPAAIGRLGHSEVSIGGAFLYPNFYLDTVAPGPNGPREGRSRSDSGLSLTSNLGVVYQPEDHPLTLGMGLNTLGGGGINFADEPGNPALSGIGPRGTVLGPVASNLVLIQLTPTAAYKITDRLIFGVGPTTTIALTSFEPAFFAPPDDANGDGLRTFPSATASRPFWGGGFRAGFVYSLTDRLDIGFGYTSPQWFETWKYNARNEVGQPRTLTLDVTLPAIYSWGVSYRPIDSWLLSLDFRYFDYENTDLYGTLIRDGGLGWQNVFTAAIGSRYQVTEHAALSLGYVYNDNPVPSVGTLFNAQSPLLTQHTISVGATLNLTESIAASLGYAYGFQNSSVGPLREAVGFGAKLESDVHLATFTMQFRFGGSQSPRTTTAPCPTAPCPAEAPCTAPGGSCPPSVTGLPAPQIGG